MSLTGKIKWYNAEKGFGFIKPDDGGPDVFVHVSALKAAGIVQLIDGQAVSFDKIEQRNGKFAAQKIAIRVDGAEAAQR